VSAGDRPGDDGHDRPSRESVDRDELYSLPTRNNRYDTSPVTSILYQQRAPSNLQQP